MLMLIARSPVRISFGGGGTDLPSYYRQFGGAVLSTSIDKYFYAILRKRTDGNVQVISSDLRKLEQWRNVSMLDVKGSEIEIPLAVLKHLQRDISADLFLSSEIPPGTGLGSSAAVCVTVLKIVSEYLHLGFSRHDLAERAYYIAREMLGNPVGKQDEYATAFGGLNFVEFSADETVTVQPVSLPREVLSELQSNLLLFFTGASHNSWEILKDQENRTRRISSVAVDALHEIKELAYTMRKALERGEVHRFGELLDVGWRAKKRVSDKISTSDIDDLYHAARNAGAIGGKITGAGGGGFMLLYCRERDQPAVRNVFLSRGLREMSFSFDFEGAHLLVNDPFIDADAQAGMRWRFVGVQDASS